jgi:hypothetical protein
MAYDVFGLDENTRPNIAGGFRFAGTHVMAFVHSDQKGSGATSGTAFTGFLVQQMTARYAQQVITIKGLNNKDQYRFTMPPEGTANVGAIIGDSGDTLKFVRQFSNPCNFRNNLHISGPTSNCVESGSSLQGLKNITMTACMISEVTLSIQLTQLAYMAQVTMSYISLIDALEEMQTNKPELPT